MNRNSPVPLWVTVCLGVAVLCAVYLLGQAPATPPEASTVVRRNVMPPASVTVSSTAAPTTAASSGPFGTSPTHSTATSTQVSNDSWRVYRNANYRFEFRYPAMWGDVEFGEASSKDGILEDVNGLRRPDTGGIFIGTFSSNAGCGFGAITPDYSYPSEMPLFVSAGWEEKSGHYYSLWPDKSIAIPNLKYDTELVPNRIAMVANNTAKALVFENAIAALEYNLLTADMNLPGQLFRGISFGCALGYKDTAATISADRQGFEFMLKSFRYAE